MDLTPLIEPAEKDSIDVQVHRCPIADCEWTYGLAGHSARHRRDANQAFADHISDDH